jgi:hypothetical protein
VKRNASLSSLLSPFAHEKERRFAKTGSGQTTMVAFLSRITLTITSLIDYPGVDDASADAGRAARGVHGGVQGAGRGGATSKTPPFLEFSLCLSRACLGKMFVFMHKMPFNSFLRCHFKVANDDHHFTKTGSGQT